MVLDTGKVVLLNAAEELVICSVLSINGIVAKDVAFVDASTSVSELVVLDGFIIVVDGSLNSYGTSLGLEPFVVICFRISLLPVVTSVDTDDMLAVFRVFTGTVVTTGVVVIPVVCVICSVVRSSL